MIDAAVAAGNARGVRAAVGGGELLGRGGVQAEVGGPALLWEWSLSSLLHQGFGWCLIPVPPPS